MAGHPEDVIRKINELIDLVAVDPKTSRHFKLKTIRLLLELKLDFLGFLAETKKRRYRPFGQAGKREKTEGKERSVLKFIGEKGGQVRMADFSALGISGRSLRRYLKDLRKQGLIEVEKRGREHFYIYKKLV